MDGIVIVKTVEAFGEFDAKMREHYGRLWSVDMPSTYPALVMWDYWSSDCGPDAIITHLIEKWHFDHPDECDSIDRVLG